MEQAPIQILVLCNGDGTRWNNYLNAPKQLAPLSSSNESLIERTIRLCATHGIQLQDIVIVSGDDRLKKIPTNHFIPKSGKWITETLLNTEQLWKEQTVVLLGDVFYSSNTLNQILNDIHTFAVYGRNGRSTYNYKRWSEIFALRFSQSIHTKIKEHLSKTVANAHAGGRGKLWEFHQSIADAALDKYHSTGNHFIEMNDWTDDIDSPAEYRQNLALCEQMETANSLIRLTHRIKIKLTRPILRRKERRLNRESKSYALSRVKI